jgi:hypothetical protein
MSPVTLKVEANEEIDSDADITFRKEFLNTVSRVGVGHDLPVALVETSSGRSFAACVATDLVPVLGELLTLARCVHHTVNARAACDV